MQPIKRSGLMFTFTSNIIDRRRGRCYIFKDKMGNVRPWLKWHGEIGLHYRTQYLSKHSFSFSCYTINIPKCIQLMVVGSTLFDIYHKGEFNPYSYWNKKLIMHFCSKNSTRPHRRETACHKCLRNGAEFI